MRAPATIAICNSRSPVSGDLFVCTVALSIAAGRAQEIFDDYDIRVVSASPEIRKAKLGQLIGELDRMRVGDEAATEFEDWCLRAIQVIFAVQLTNIELHPNGAAVQRRDVVATNLTKSPFWRRIREDYGVRQVIFEVKNYKDMGPEEYRQMTTYLAGEYGNAGFIVTRDDSENLLSDRELPWMREIYNRQKKLVVKLTGSFLRRILSKLRSPQRHDEADQQLNKLFDVYTRNYLGEPTGPGRRRRKKKGELSRRCDGFGVVDWPQRARPRQTFGFLLRCSTASTTTISSDV